MDNSKTQTLQEVSSNQQEKKVSSTTITAKGEIKRDHNPKEDALFQLTSAIKHGDINKITNALIEGGLAKNAPGFGESEIIEENPYILVLQSAKIPQKVKMQIIEQMHEVGVPHESQKIVNLNVTNKLAPPLNVQHNAVLYLIYTHTAGTQSSLLEMINIFNSDKDKQIYLDAMRQGIISDPVIIKALSAQGVEMSKDDMYQLANHYIENANIEGIKSLIEVGLDLDYAPQYKRSLISGLLSHVSKPQDAKSDFDQEFIISPYNNKESEEKKLKQVMILKLMLDNGVEINHAHKGVDAQPAFVTNSSILQMLLEYGADPNAVLENGMGLDGYSPIHRAIQHGNLAALKLLFEYGTNPNAAVYEGKTLEEYAKSHFKYTSYPHKDAMMKLIQEYQKTFTFTPKPITFEDNILNKAVISKDIEKIKELCQGNKMGLDMKQQAAMLAIRRNDIATLKAIVESSKLDMEVRMTNGITPLIYAIKLGQHGIINYLLDELNVNPNIADKEGKTPVMHLLSNTAYLSKNIENIFEHDNSNAPALLNKLFVKGANINAQDNEGNTALFYCRSSGSVVNVVGVGCNPLTKNNSGITAIEYFEQHKAIFPELNCMRMLDQKEAEKSLDQQSKKYREELQEGFREVLKKIIEESKDSLESFSKNRLISQIGVSKELLESVETEVAKIKNSKTTIIEDLKGYKSKEALYIARLEESVNDLANATYKSSLKELPLASRTENAMRRKMQENNSRNI